MTLIEAIMSREQCSIEEAKELFNEIVEECKNRSEEPIEEVLFDWGFEPDYVLDIFAAIP